MNKVLIVSPNFAPLNTPDLQRVRLALPHLRDQGWEPTVLAVQPEYAGTGVLDPLLEQTYPRDIRVVRVRGLPPRATAWLGFGTLWLRCGAALRTAGDALLARERFDLVFFSTTIFDTFTFGPRWRQRYGVRYVLDYQDPWVNRYYDRTGTPPPGGRLKFGLTQRAARRREPTAVRDASAIVSVSDSYRRELIEAYQLDPNKIEVLPFGTSPDDLALAARHTPAAPLIRFEDGNSHHVYVGRCGDDMTVALTALFRALRRFRSTHATAASRLRFHFIGTDYAAPPRGREWVRPIAVTEGVGDMVHEHPARVPYFDSLHYILKAAALPVVGSADPTYAASKVFPYMLARRPMLLVFNAQSLVLKIAAEVDAGERIAFDAQTTPDALATAVYERWFASGAYLRVGGFNEAKFLPYTAASTTARLAGIFDRAVAADVS